MRTNIEKRDDSESERPRRRKERQRERERERERARARVVRQKVYKKLYSSTNRQGD